MTETEAAWLAGIIEGEGCFSRNTKYSVRLAVEMADADVIARVKRLLAANTRTYVRDRGKENLSITYTTYLQNKARLKEVTAAVYPYLGRRRQAKCRELGIAPE